MIKFISLEEYKNNILKKDEVNLKSFAPLYRVDKRLETFTSDFKLLAYFDFLTNKLFEHYGFVDGTDVVLLHNGDAFLFNSQKTRKYIINYDESLSKTDLAYKVLLFLFSLTDHIYSLFKENETLFKEHLIHIYVFKRSEFYKLYEKRQSIIDF